MTDEVQNLVLEHLKAIRLDIGTIKSDIRELTNRVGRIEISMTSLRRDIGHYDEATAESSVRLDRINERLERVERRLELG
jgi:chromosome segregation ATPase